MNLKYKGIDVYFNQWTPKDKIIKTDENQIIMHPYTGGIMMLETTAHNYLDVFKSLGVTKFAIDACCDSAIKLINSKIDRM